MIAGEFDLSVGSVIGAAGMVVCHRHQPGPAGLAGCDPRVRVRARRGLPERLPRRSDAAAVLHRHPGDALHPARPDHRHHPPSTGRTQVGWASRTPPSPLDPIPSRPSSPPISARFLPCRSCGGSAWRWWRPSSCCALRSATGSSAWAARRSRRATWACPSAGSRSSCSWPPRPRPRCLPSSRCSPSAAATCCAGTTRSSRRSSPPSSAAALLTGGYGSAIGPVFGALTLGITKQGIVFAGIPGDWYLAFLGVLLLAAVIVNNYIRQRATMTRH